MLALAAAYGIEGRRATSPEALEETLRDVLRQDTPVLIEVPVGPMPQMRFAPRG
jgi:thiamine pyrophosphate-dependent acetolactate synthase large subunit-like protein